MVFISCSSTQIQNVFMSWEVGFMSSSCQIQHLTIKHQGKGEYELGSRINTLFPGDDDDSDAVYFSCYHQTSGLLKGNGLVAVAQPNLCSSHQALEKMSLVITLPPFHKSHMHSAKPPHGLSHPSAKSSE